MMYIRSCFLFLLSFCLLSSCIGVKSSPSSTSPPEEFRVLGYLFSSSDWSEGMDEVDFSKYTDINLAFIQPDEEGMFERKPVFAEIVNQAHENNARVFISIGGGGPPEYLGDLMKPEMQETWINEMVDFTLEYDFDGIDVDLENALINEDYASFVSNLSKKLKAEGKLMTAALASWNGDKIADETLALYDFINIMSYDATGPWNLEKPGQHAPYQMVVDDFNYYHETRGIAPEKLLIGLPFYGYGFGDGAPGSLRYHEILDRFPAAHESNDISFEEGGMLYYNGPDLIREKAAFAKASGAAGVMVWHIQADAKGPHSLLSAIFQAL